MHTYKKTIVCIGYSASCTAVVFFGSFPGVCYAASIVCIGYSVYCSSFLGCGWLHTYKKTIVHLGYSQSHALPTNLFCFSRPRSVLHNYNQAIVNYAAGPVLPKKSW